MTPIFSISKLQVRARSLTLCVAILLTTAGSAFAQTSPVKPGVADPAAFSGVWVTTSQSLALVPADGKPLPFTTSGKALYQGNVSGLKNGKITDEAVHLCLPEGMPRAMTSPYPMQIISTPDQFTFFHESNRAFRMVRLADKHADPDVWDPSYMGEGIAKWQGDTLVIDSTNFKSDRIYLDATGLPASDQLHLVERIRTLDGGARLEDRITIEDPAVFSRAWTAVRVFERRDDIKVRTDWVCGEKHRDLTALKTRSSK